MSGDHNKHAFDGMTIDASAPIKTDWPESAFPSTFRSMSPELHQVHRWGMQLRDYFAAKAMQALLARNDRSVASSREFIGKTAYEYADAMMKERDKK